MRRLLMLSIAALGVTLAGTGVQAQPAVSQTQNPPAPNAQNSDLGQAPNSLPRGGATGGTIAPGGALGGQATSPSAAYSPSDSGVNTLHPLHQPRHRSARRSRHHVTHRAPASQS